MMYKNLTQKTLRSLLTYNEETGIFIWKKRPGNEKYTKIWNKRFYGKVAGNILPSGYREICIHYKSYLTHRLAWLYVHGEVPEQLDHKNMRKADNRIANLRAATYSQNNHNRGISARNKSGYKGVHLSKKNNKWLSRITYHKKIYDLGEYNDAVTAHLVYCGMAKALHGEFARFR